MEIDVYVWATSEWAPPYPGANPLKPNGPQGTFRPSQLSLYRFLEVMPSIVAEAALSELRADVKDCVRVLPVLTMGEQQGKAFPPVKLKISLAGDSHTVDLRNLRNYVRSRIDAFFFHWSHPRFAYELDVVNRGGCGIIVNADGSEQRRY